MNLSTDLLKIIASYTVKPKPTRIPKLESILTFLEKNFEKNINNKIDWLNLSYNPNAIHVLEQTTFEIDKIQLKQDIEIQTQKLIKLLLSKDYDMCCIT